MYTATRRTRLDTYTPTEYMYRTRSKSRCRGGCCCPRGLRRKGRILFIKQGFLHKTRPSHMRTPTEHGVAFLIALAAMLVTDKLIITPFIWHRVRKSDISSTRWFLLHFVANMVGCVTGAAARRVVPGAVWRVGPSHTPFSRRTNSPILSSQNAFSSCQCDNAEVVAAC